MVDFMPVRPLHRIAEWKPHPDRVRLMLCLLNWLIVGALSYMTAIFRLTPAWQPASPFCVLAIILLIPAVIQTLVLLWRWEERHEPRPNPLVVITAGYDPLEMAVKDIEMPIEELVRIAEERA